MAKSYGGARSGSPQLQKFEASRMISPVDQFDWAAPTVPVMKQNDHVRVCGNYSTVQR